MSESTKEVTIKVEIKKGSNYKFQYKGSLDKALKLAIFHLQTFRKEVAHLGIEE